MLRHTHATGLIRNGVPIEVAARLLTHRSSGSRKACRLSRRGNRRLNHAIHMAAVTQIRYRHSPGRAYYDKKLAEGKTPKEALRALKRQISDAIFTCLQADARHAAAKSPGGQPGNGSASSAAGSHPGHRLFGQATPGPATHPTTPTAPFPAQLPSRASGRPGPGPGAARPRSGARRASSTRGAREPIMPRSGQGHSHQAPSHQHSTLTSIQRGVRSARFLNAEYLRSMLTHNWTICIRTRAGVARCPRPGLWPGRPSGNGRSLSHGWGNAFARSIVAKPSDGLPGLSLQRVRAWRLSCQDALTSRSHELDSSRYVLQSRFLGVSLPCRAR